MRVNRVIAAGLSILTACVATLAAQQSSPTFKSGTQIVSLFVTVADSQRRLVPDLSQQDFDVFDNDKPQTISYFENIVQPITVVVMLDTSGSMTGNLTFLKAAAEQFLIRLLPDDRARVGAFNDRIQFGRPLTGNRDQLVSDVKDLDYGNGTRLWDSIAASLDELKPVDGRRVILVFTDGDDTESNTRLGTVIDRARNEDVMVYGIGFESVYFNGQRMVRSKPDGGLQKLADETGGGYFELQKTGDMAPTFTRVAQELHSQYVIGFAPTLLDNKVHRLAVKIKQSGMTARARRSYVAASDKFALGDKP